MATKSESKNRKGHGDVVKNVDVDDSSFSTRQNAEVVDESSSLQERDEVEGKRTPSSDSHPTSRDSVDGNFMTLPSGLMNYIVSILLEN